MSRLEVLLHFGERQLDTAGPSWQRPGMLGCDTVVVPVLIGSASRKHQLLIPQIGTFIKKLA